METIYGSVLLRPTRIGLLVRPNQQNYLSVREFIRICNCLWGGTFNPIIPVSRTLPNAWRRDHFKEISGTGLADAYLGFFEPDVFIEAEAGLADEVGIKNLRGSFYPRAVPLEKFIEVNSRGIADFTFGLSVLDIYKRLYRKEFQFASREPRKAAIIDNPDPFFECVFGSFPHNKKLRYLSKAFEDAFEPEKLSPTADTCLKLYKEHCLVPLQATHYKLKIDFERHGDGPAIFVFDPTSTTDLIDFWNFRQFRHDVIGINIHWFETFRDMLRELIEANYRPLPGNNNGIMITTTVEFARSIDNAKAESIAKTYLANLTAGSGLHPVWMTPT